MEELPSKEIFQKIMQRDINRIDTTYKYPNNIISKLYYNISGMLPDANIEKDAYLKKIKIYYALEGIFINTLPFERKGNIRWLARTTYFELEAEGETEFESAVRLSKNIEDFLTKRGIS